MIGLLCASFNQPFDVYPIPDWFHKLGMFVALSSAFAIPIAGVYQLYLADGDGLVEVSPPDFGFNPCTEILLIDYSVEGHNRPRHVARYAKWLRRQDDVGVGTQGDQDGRHVIRDITVILTTVLPVVCLVFVYSSHLSDPTYGIYANATVCKSIQYTQSVQIGHINVYLFSYLK